MAVLGRYVLSALMSLSLLFLLPAQQAGACQPFTLFIGSSLVFSGTVVAKDETTTTFAVDHVYYGVWSKATIVVRSGPFYNNYVPNLEFTVGQVYTVYSELYAFGASTGPCSPTHSGPVSANEERLLTTVSPYSLSYGQDVPTLLKKSADGVCSAPVTALSADVVEALCVPEGQDVWEREALLGTTGDVLYLSVLTPRVARPHIATGMSNLRVYADVLGRLWLLGTSGEVGPANYVVAQRLQSTNSTNLVIRKGPGRSVADVTSTLTRYLDALSLPPYFPAVSDSTPDNTR